MYIFHFTSSVCSSSIAHCLSSIILASFTSPESLETNPALILWMLPLVAAIAIAYKATKVKAITAAKFAKEVAVLFGSIIIFMVLTALVLHVFALLFT